MVKINDLAGYTNPNTILYERMKYYIGNTKSKHKVLREDMWGCRGETRGFRGKARGLWGRHGVP